MRFDIRVLAAGILALSANSVAGSVASVSKPVSSTPASSGTIVLATPVDFTFAASMGELSADDLGIRYKNPVTAPDSARIELYVSNWGPEESGHRPKPHVQRVAWATVSQTEGYIPFSRLNVTNLEGQLTEQLVNGWMYRIYLFKNDSYEWLALPRYFTYTYYPGTLQIDGSSIKWSISTRRPQRLLIRVYQGRKVMSGGRVKEDDVEGLWVTTVLHEAYEGAISMQELRLQVGEEYTVFFYNYYSASNFQAPPITFRVPA